MSNESSHAASAIREAAETSPKTPHAEVVASSLGFDAQLLRSRSKTLITSATLAWVGGSLDAFTYIGHGHVFANAMTGNVVLLGADLVSGSWRQCLSHILPIGMFLLGVASAKAICHRRASKFVRSTELTVLLVEIAVFFALGWLPLHTPNFVITMSIAFVASLQMATFRDINGRSFSSTFTTGNLRTMIENGFDWLFEGQQPVHRAAARDFATICSIFLLGALTGAFATPGLHNRVLWIDSAVLAMLLVWLFRTPKRL